MPTINDRVRALFDHLGTNAHAFADAHGMVASSLYNISRNNRKPNSETLERMCAVEPRISAEYLLRGEGEPLRNLNAPTALSTVQQLREFQIQMNEFIEKRVKELER